MPPPTRITYPPFFLIGVSWLYCWKIWRRLGDVSRNSNVHKQKIKMAAQIKSVFLWNLRCGYKYFVWQTNTKKLRPLTSPGRTFRPVYFYSTNAETKTSKSPQKPLSLLVRHAVHLGFLTVCMYRFSTILPNKPLPRVLLCCMYWAKDLPLAHGWTQLLFIIYFVFGVGIGLRRKKQINIWTETRILQVGFEEQKGCSFAQIKEGKMLWTRLIKQRVFPMLLQ